ncbi:hypothetical protein SCG7086_AK_00210 [Chlamydiales bacterium SCGC AG-110-P3]|nr:hypothetical protein SCG7086_AK_00210 [Chlamydiales bacterium SCGC AG-110-P3]
MLPLYLAGNLHCIGMCGPLVMMIGKHRYRYYYFAGRALSFSLAGFTAGLCGGALHTFLTTYHIPAATSFLFGAVILIAGVCSLLKMDYPGQKLLAQRLSGVNYKLALLMGRDQPLSTFLFGFFTVALPCGQTLIVFSACALAGDAGVGLFNGFAFAAITSPSLWMAMRAQGLIGRLKGHYNTIMGTLAIAVGLLACARGLAEMSVIPHMVLNQNASAQYHIVLY